MPIRDYALSGTMPYPAALSAVRGRLVPAGYALSGCFIGGEGKVGAYGLCPIGLLLSAVRGGLVPIRDYSLSGLCPIRLLLSAVRNPER